MRILVIGGTGVLSRAIAVSAAAEGHEVTIVTDGRGPLPEPARVALHIQVDRRDHTALASAVATFHGWDLVVDTVGYTADDAEGLLTAIRGKTPHIIAISSAVVYDRRSTMPLKPDAPIAPLIELGGYGAGKVRMESVWRRAWQSEDCPVTILRLPHVLGIGCELGAVPLHNRDPGLAARILQRRPVLLADGGRQVFQVVYNEDVARGILASAGNEFTFGKIYNCAHPEPLTGREYLEAVADALGVELRVKEVSTDAVRASGWGWELCAVSRVLDVESLRAEIGVVPSTPPRQAIRTVLDYLIQQRDALLREPSSYLDPAIDIDPEYPNVVDVLARCAAQRPRSPIDLRMNPAG